MLEMFSLGKVYHLHQQWCNGPVKGLILGCDDLAKGLSLGYDGPVKRLLLVCDGPGKGLTSSDSP